MRAVAGLALLAATLVPASPATARPRAAETTPATPLTVTLTSMTPGAVPRKGVVTLTGRVKNSTEDQWRGVNVAPFVSASPITTRDALAEAVATTEEVAVGDRVIDTRYNAALGDLEPGRTATFRLSLPVSVLGASPVPGVYWIGVHALGTSPEGRDDVADGRARTFIPLLSPARARSSIVPVSVTLQLRERVRRDPAGRLTEPERWAALTRPEGRLSRLADFAASAGTDPLTWVLDPAVPDALDDFAAGNPSLSLGSAEPLSSPGASPSPPGATNEGSQGPGPSPSATDSPTDSPTDDPTDSPTDSPSGSPSGTPSDGARVGAPAADVRERARSVLTGLVGSVRANTLLATGYADPDVVALARRQPSLLNQANALAARRLKARDLTADPVVAPPDGVFDADLLDQLSQDSLLVLSDRGRLADPPSARLPTGQGVIFTDARASAGGPAPTAPLNPLALRQRILSEAALEILAPSGQAAGETAPPRPLVVTLPAGWNPGPSWRESDFFSTLSETAWLRLVPVPRGASTTYDKGLGYGRGQREEEVGDANVAATRTLVRTGTVLGDLLDTENDVDERLTGAALATSSYSARARPRRAIEQAVALDSTVRAQMRRVQVTGTDFVTLSGESGSLTVTLVNQMKQPVTVGVRVETSSPDVRVETPGPVEMQPGQRTTRRLSVVSSGPGVHDITVYPVTTAGEDLGSTFTFSLRISTVGRLIWYILGAGGTLLAVLIVRRIVLRVRNHRWREAGL